MAQQVYQQSGLLLFLLLLLFVIISPITFFRDGTVSWFKNVTVSQATLGPITQVGDIFDILLIDENMLFVFALFSLDRAASTRHLNIKDSLFKFMY